MKYNLTTTLVIALIVAGVAFYGGMQYQQSQRGSLANGQFAGQRAGGVGGFQRGGLANGFRPVTGEILSLDSGSVTVKLQDGSSKIVLLTDKTGISKSTAGSISDLKKGEHVAAFGTQNSDGSVTAQTIQLNPVMRGQRSMPTPAK